MDNNRIIVAFDFPDRAPARALLSQLNPTHCRIKIGKEMFTRFGPDWVQEVQRAGFAVFLDLKFHDIPNTVRAACQAAVDLGVWMVNVHAMGGARMLEAARAAVPAGTHLIAVTMLTSLADTDLAAIGLQSPIENRVLQLANLAKDTGIDGVVCSAQEAAHLRAHCGEGFELVCPGIQWGGLIGADQRRVMLPKAALDAGADYLVIGRAITAAPNPTQALQEIVRACA